MKKLLLSLSVFGFFATANAQMNVTITDSLGNAVTGTTVNYTVPAANVDTRYWHINNMGSSALTVKVKKTVTVLNDAGATVYFCTDANCYSPAQSLSLNVSLSASTGTSLLTTDFNPNSVQGTTIVRYTIINQANPSDTAYYLINYTINNPAGINTSVIIKPSVSNPSPNPASSYFSMNYKMGNASTENSKLVIYNMLGVRVMETRVEEIEGTIRVDVSNLDQGIYFCSLESDGKTLTTKRLVVTH